MCKMNALDWICTILVVVGGLNWGLIGFFDFNLVQFIFSDSHNIARIVYAIVGLASLYLIYACLKPSK